jgi:hypothetical protein
MSKQRAPVRQPDQDVQQAPAAQELAPAPVQEALTPDSAQDAAASHGNAFVAGAMGGGRRR